MMGIGEMLIRDKMRRINVLLGGAFLMGFIGGCSPKNTDSIAIIGKAEYVTVFPQNYRYPARIDTGATTSSISALDIERFKKEAENWVRFRLPLPSDDPKAKVVKSKFYEYPVTRDATIKGPPDTIRPTIELLVELGSFKELIEFTLVDRSDYDYPVLVGRNLLEGFAAVDVSKSYIAEEF